MISVSLAGGVGEREESGTFRLKGTRFQLHITTDQFDRTLLNIYSALYMCVVGEARELPFPGSMPAQSR